MASTSLFYRDLLPLPLFSYFHPFPNFRNTTPLISPQATDDDTQSGKRKKKEYRDLTCCGDSRSGSEREDEGETSFRVEEKMKWKMCSEAEK